jgi:hypothetical protein
MRHHPVDTSSHRGWTIAIHHDPDCESPRDWCNHGTIWAGHAQARFASPDPMPASSVLDSVIARFGGHDGPSARAALTRAAIWLPVYRFEHSGVAWRTRPFHCPWDSARVGIVFVAKDRVRATYGARRIGPALRRSVEAQLSAEVETYGQWANGDCYGYRILDADGAETDASCWGFIGDPQDSFLIAEARDEIDAMIAERHRIRSARLKTLIAHRVPLALRPGLLATP